MFEDRNTAACCLPFSENSETFMKSFINKHNPSFKLRIEVKHYSCVICKGLCSCKKSSVGWTVRNAQIRWDKHHDVKKSSEPANHLKGAYYIKMLSPTLNWQWDNKTLRLLEISLCESINFSCFLFQLIHILL